MDPIGLPHLRIPGKNTRPQKSLKSFLKKHTPIAKDFQSTSVIQSNSFARLYVAVNTPPCDFQKRLAVEVMKTNCLIALPKAMDAFFVGYIVAFNFRRWFSTKKVLFIASSSERSTEMRNSFVCRTGFPLDETCVYGVTKKTQRSSEWSSSSIIFATAENLMFDCKGTFGEDVGLLIIDEAERAANGSHSICSLTRNLLLLKACFRLVAFTDCHLNKAATLQSIVMNLQIGCIHSTGNLLSDMLLTVSSPRLTTLYIPVTEEVNTVANALIKVMKPLIALLYEAGALPTVNLQQLVNFSERFLAEAVTEKCAYLNNVFKDLCDLLAAYDTLMCEGLTAFAYNLHEKVTNNEGIRNIVDANDIVKTAYLMPNLSKNSLRFHKLDTCFKIIESTILKHGNEKSILVILCRNRHALWFQNLVSTVREKFRQNRVNIVSCDPTSAGLQKLSPSLKHGLCNVILIPCDYQRFSLDVGYIDTLICFDEGLSLLHFTNGISVVEGGQIYSLCTGDYEVNLCQLESIVYAKDTVQTPFVKAVNLCRDNVKIFSADWNPKIVEYWSKTRSTPRVGFLSAFEEIVVDDYTGLNTSSKESPSYSLTAQEHLLLYAEESLFWLDKPLQSEEVGPSTTTLKLAEVLGSTSDELNFEKERLEKELPTNDTFDNSLDGLVATSALSSISLNETMAKDSGVPNLQSRQRGRNRVQAPPPRRLNSASITSLLMKTTKLSDECFFDPLESSSAYVERAAQMKKIIEDLKRMLCN